MYLNSDSQTKSISLLEELIQSQSLLPTSPFLEYWTSLTSEEKEALATLDEKEIIDEFCNALYDFSIRAQTPNLESMKTTYKYSQPNKPSIYFSVIHLNHLSDLFDDSLRQEFVNSAVILQMQNITPKDSSHTYSQNALLIEEKQLREYIHDIGILEGARMLFKIKSSHLESYVQAFDQFNSFGTSQETIIRRDQYKNYFSGSYVNAMMLNYNFGTYNRKDPTICQLKLTVYLEALITLIGSNLRRAYWKSVPGSMEFLMEQIPIRSSPTLAEPIYFNSNAYPYFRSQRRDQYSQGIYFGRLSFKIRDETVEENEYTGIAIADTARRRSEEAYYEDQNAQSGYKRHHSGSYKSKTFFIEKQQLENTDSQKATQQGMDALEFLLGSQNPLVVRNQQQKLAKIQSETLSTPINKNSTLQPPLLQDVINFGLGTAQLNKTSQTTQPLTPQGGSNFPTEVWVKKQNDFFRTPEKKASYKSMPETPEKLNGPVIFTSSVLTTPTKQSLTKIAEDPSRSKRSGKPQKKLKYKANEYHVNGDHTSIALSFFPSNGNTTTPVKRSSVNSILIPEADNNELFPPLLEANKKTFASPKNKILT